VPIAIGTFPFSVFVSDGQVDDIRNRRPIAVKKCFFGNDPVNAYGAFNHLYPVYLLGITTH